MAAGGRPGEVQADVITINGVPRSSMIVSTRRDRFLPVGVPRLLESQHHWSRHGPLSAVASPCDHGVTDARGLVTRPTVKQSLFTRNEQTTWR